jgi:hypothetical protein
LRWIAQTLRLSDFRIFAEGTSSIAFSADGRFLAYTIGSGANVIDLVTDSNKAVNVAPRSAVGLDPRIALSPDGRLLAITVVDDAA